MEIFGNGLFWAFLGAALAALLPGIGSARGCGMVGEAATGLLAEEPSKFGSAIILEALPGTQGIYGLLIAFLSLLKLNVFGGVIEQISLGQGIGMFLACLPIAFVGLFSAIFQARCAVGGVAILAKKPKDVFKGVSLAAVVETFAIFALLISFLMLYMVNWQ